MSKEAIEKMVADGLMDKVEAHRQILLGENIRKIKWALLFNSDETHFHGDVEFYDENESWVVDWDAENDWRLLHHPYPLGFDYAELTDHETGEWELDVESWETKMTDTLYIDDCIRHGSTDVDSDLARDLGRDLLNHFQRLRDGELPNEVAIAIFERTIKNVLKTESK
jgi:hypothetical protein